MSPAYKAFISYRRTSLDTRAARLIQRKLESFRVPAAFAGAGPGRRLGKLFRDVDELAASSDLSQTIRQALEQSEYLIVICSPDTPQSAWVRAEIAQFRALGRGDCILPVLIQGTPEEAVLPLFDGAQPLAADWRHPVSGRFAAGRAADVCLRLAAPMIGCVYDDLKRRAHRRTMAVLGTSMAASVAVMVALAGLSLRLYQVNQDLHRSNEELRGEIIQTTATLGQFMVATQDDYKRWSTAMGKIMDIVQGQDLERARKARALLTEYVVKKGYEPKDDRDVQTVFEAPERFLKTVLFRKPVYTVDLLWMRHESLFLLDSLVFPARLFEFFASPPPNLPPIYQRMDSASRQNLLRYAVLLRAIEAERMGDASAVLDNLDQADRLGLFHSLGGSFSHYDLNSFSGLPLIEGRVETKEGRPMTEGERANLIDSMAAYHAAVLRYAMSGAAGNVKFVDYRDAPLGGAALTLDNIAYLSGMDRGTIHFREIVGALDRAVDGRTDDPEILELRQKLAVRWAEHDRELAERRPPTFASIQAQTRRALDALVGGGGSGKEAEESWVDGRTTLLEDVGYIDEAIDAMSQQARDRLVSLCGIGKGAETSGREIRIAIAQSIRPYTVFIGKYDEFVDSPSVRAVLATRAADTSVRRPHILLALYRHAARSGQCEEATKLKAQLGGTDHPLLHAASRCPG